MPNKKSQTKRIETVLTAAVEGMISKANNLQPASSGLKSYIKDYLSYWVEHKKELEFHFLSMVRVIASPELLDMYQNHTRRMIAFFEGLYIKGTHNGEFQGRDIKSSAVSLMAAIDGIIFNLVIGGILSLDDIELHFERQFIL